MCFAPYSRWAAAETSPSIDEVRETLKRYNSSGLIPRPVLSPKGVADFNNALALQSKKNATAADFKEAARLYQSAIDAGLPQASTNLALLYLEGKGVKKDSKKALTLLDAASKNNDSQADVILARTYLLGTDVQMDVKKAERLLNKAIKAGNKNAVAMLAEYKEWKKKNDLATKQYQEMMKKIQNQPPPVTTQAVSVNEHINPALQGYDFLENHPVPLANYILPPSPRLTQIPVPPAVAKPSKEKQPDSKDLQPLQLFPTNAQPVVPIPTGITPSQ